MDLLNKMLFLEKDAESFGFKWDDVGQIMQQIYSEYVEVQEHTLNGIKQQDRVLLQEEIGDLLHAVLSLTVFSDFDPEETLGLAVSKFERRFNAVKTVVHNTGLDNLIDSSFDERMAAWDKAKEMVG